MVQAVRRGESLRHVARRFGVSPGTVAFWVKRAGGRRLDRCNFSDRKAGPRAPWNRTAPKIECHVLALRRRLREESLLGEYGAGAIHRALRAEDAARAAPSPATVRRILKRHGATARDARTRRRPPPPRGWWLPAVVGGERECDSFDFIEDLKLAGGPLLSVLTATSLHGGWVEAWPRGALGAREVVGCLMAHWQGIGLPGYAQFDNDTRFQGAHQFPDTLGRVTRLCLALGVIPVFVPPREMGFQNAVESFNALWQAKVWQRYRFPDLVALQRHSARYVTAHHARSAPRRERAPARGAFPGAWRFDPQAPLRGTVIYLRRTDAHGAVSLLGHCFRVDRAWGHRLVRCEVELHRHRIVCYGLRWRDPADQPLLAELPYTRAHKPFLGDR